MGRRPVGVRRFFAATKLSVPCSLMRFASHDLLYGGGPVRRHAVWLFQVFRNRAHDERVEAFFPGAVHQPMVCGCLGLEIVTACDGLWPSARSSSVRGRETPGPNRRR